jgi:tetratricopeptide (TPR) repeat protein
MSPEQVTGVSANVDTRSDVYALGVIAYELLTGQVPHAVSGMTIPQAVRTIEQDDAAPLSSVDRMFRGDIDTIVSKALEKEKDRRYQSASDMAADIRRYLADQPITAHPPTTIYQLRKFARRNKALVGGAFATFLALLIGVIGISIQAVRIARERDHARQAERVAEQRRDEAEVQRAEAQSQRAEAQRQAAIAQAVNEFLNNDLLATVAPEHKGKDVLMRDVLDAASEAIGGKFDDSPPVEASIRTTLGNTYKKLGAYEVAEKHLDQALALGRTALGKEHTRTVAAMSNLANLYRVQGRLDEAEPLLVRALELRRRDQGEEHPDTLNSINNLANIYIDQGRYDMAEPLYVQTLEIRRRLLGEMHPDTLLSMNNLAALYQDRGRIEKAEPLYLKTLQSRREVLGEEHPHTVLTLSNLAVMYHNSGQLEKAAPLYDEVVELRRRVLGEDHPRTLQTKANLAMLLSQQGRFDEAEPLYMSTLEIQRGLLGEEHPDTLTSLNSLAVLYERQRRFDEAEPIYVRVLEVRRRVLGEEHPRTLMSTANLGNLRYMQGRYAEAERLFVKALELKRRVFGEEHRSTHRTRGDLLATYKRTGQLDKARPLVADVLAGRRKQATGPGASASDMNAYAWELLTCLVHDLRDPVTALEFATKAVAASNEQNLSILDTLSLAQHMTGDSNAAIETQRKAIALLPPGPSIDRTDLESSLAKYLAAAHRFTEAEPLLLGLHQQLVEDGNESPSKIRASAERLITLYDSWHAAEPDKGYDAKAAKYRALLPEG